MCWRRDWSASPPRRKVRRLAADEQKKLLAQMAKGIARSPALSGFGVQRSGSEDLESGPGHENRNCGSLPTLGTRPAGSKKRQIKSSSIICAGHFSSPTFGTEGHAQAWDGPPGLGGVRDFQPESALSRIGF